MGRDYSETTLAESSTLPTLAASSSLLLQRSCVPFSMGICPRTQARLQGRGVVWDSLLFVPGPAQLPLVPLSREPLNTPLIKSRGHLHGWQSRSHFSLFKELMIQESRCSSVASEGEGDKHLPRSHFIKDPSAPAVAVGSELDTLPSSPLDGLLFHK